MPEADREKWNAKYGRADHVGMEPSSVLLGLSSLLPKSGTALDIAGGAGRHSIWLAKRGLEVTLIDISEIGLKLARERAVAEGCSIETCQLDLELESLPRGPWDLVLVVHFLHRPLMARIPEILAEGGTLVAIHPTSTNLDRHERPPARFLLDRGELPRLASGLNVVEYREGWQDEGRHEAVLVARKGS